MMLRPNARRPCHEEYEAVRGRSSEGDEAVRFGNLRTARLLAIGLVAVGAVLVSGCTAARDTLGTNSSP
jgi:hypothetical protein